VFKTAVIFVFISSLLVQSGFVSLYTISEIRKHKKAVKTLMKAELKNGLHNADLTKFSEKDLENAEWEHSKEFFLGDEKYDVVKIENTKQGKLYHCINDKKEIELFKSLDKNKKQKTVLDDLLKKFCMISKLFKVEEKVSSSLKQRFCSLNTIDYKNQYAASLYRPPIQLS
jgi:hypothetical protein